MKKFGFNSRNEFLPAFDKFQAISSRRLMFLKLFNQHQSCFLKFSKKEFCLCKTNSLFEIFVIKIAENLQCCVNYPKKIEFDIEKTKQINSFLKKTKIRTKVPFTKYSIKPQCKSELKKSIKFIELLLENDFSLFLDGEKSFKKFVSNKILNSSFNREVTVSDDCIDIVSLENSFQTKIFTFWQFINSKKLDINNHINKAVKCINESEFKQVYLVYPKNDEFYKHISVRCSDMKNDEYSIKLIPYSMRSTLR